MKPLEKDELYQHLSGFLKTRGIELKEGSYAQCIQKSCHLLGEAINLSQEGFERAKAGMDKKLDQMRQVIHEKTAPKPPEKTSTAAAPPASAQKEPSAPKPASRKPRARKQPGSRKTRR
jgi:hypothetical protein